MFYSRVTVGTAIFSLFCFCAQAVQAEDVLNDINLQARFYSGELKQSETATAFAATTKLSGQEFSVSYAIQPNVELGLKLKNQKRINTHDNFLPGFSVANSLADQQQKIGAFGNVTFGPVSLNLGARFGLDEYQLVRPDQLSSLVAKSQSNGHNYGAHAELSALLPISKSVILRPVANIDYDYFTVKAFTESGAGPSNVSYDKIVDERLEGQLGLSTVLVLPQEHFNSSMLFATAKFKKNFITGPIKTHATAGGGFIDLGEVALLSGKEAEGWVYNAGAIIKAEGDLELLLAYEVEVFPTSVSNAFSIKFKKTF